MIRAPRVPRKAKTIKRWTATDGTRYAIRQRADGNYIAEATSKDGEDYNIAMGASPKAALAHLTDDEKYTDGDKI